MKVNLNDYAEVVLTDVGAEIWNDNEMGFAKYNIRGWEPRLKQPGDTLRQQIWSLMSIFGSYVGLGMPVPFEQCGMIVLEGHS